MPARDLGPLLSPKYRESQNLAATPDLFSPLGRFWAQPGEGLSDKGGVYSDSTEAAGQHRRFGDGGVHGFVGSRRGRRVGSHLRHRYALGRALPVHEALDQPAASLESLCNQPNPLYKKTKAKEKIKKNNTTALERKNSKGLERRLAGDTRGLSTVEYLILLVLIAVAGIKVWDTIGGTITTKATKANTDMTGM